MPVIKRPQGTSSHEECFEASGIFTAGTAVEHHRERLWGQRFFRLATGCIADATRSTRAGAATTAAAAATTAAATTTAATTAAGVHGSAAVFNGRFDH